MGGARWWCGAASLPRLHPKAALSLLSPTLPLAGSALEALQRFFQALVASGAQGAGAQALLDQLRQAGTGAHWAGLGWGVLGGVGTR